MIKRLIIRVMVLLVLTVPAVGLAQAQRPEPPLTNASVVKLVRAGFKEKTIIAIIHSRPNKFDVDPDRLIELKRSGVSENIILTMLAQQDPTFEVNEDEWNDQAFFKGRRPSPEGNSGDSQAGGTDIFGSGGSSQDQTRGRGMRGGNQGETTTSGSATVRILRPPAEAGGGSAKLEKTPTLDNEAIIRLVEAGFSEGTIIKRIQDSPADFDLSGDKLQELRKRRVTDPIIAAMTAAMDGSDQSKNTPGASKEN